MTIAPRSYIQEMITQNPIVNRQSSIANPFGLYLVMTDPVVGYEECARIAAGEGVKVVQLRMKGVVRDAYIRTAERVRDILARGDSLFIVNDDVEVARAVDADGLHLGQDDMALEEARRIWQAPGKLFGLSTHGQGQDAAAQARRPDYIGVGPVYPTPTKAIPDPTVGLDDLRRVVAACPLPLVAIGGIHRATLPAVLRTGVRNYAVVRAVCAAQDPRAAIRDLRRVERATLASLAR
ncbi:MAG: thiamine phosphate synthase [Kiritimatiellae bacterium]|nr:thiamine phosphate synthase [Kiritimatiellia bacterium]